MKTSLMLVSAVVLCALSTGCANINLARRGCGSCASCAAKTGGCDQIACSGVASSGGGVSAAGPGAVSPTPGAVAGTPGPYDPGIYGGGGYGGGGYGRGGHFGRGGGGYGMDGGYGGPPSAQVAYPYYTTRGPRDFLTNNPPSIGY